MRNSTAGLLPKLVCCSVIMSLPIRGIAVLVRIEIFFRFCRDHFLHATNRSVCAFIARSNHQLRAKRGQNSLALVRGAVRQAQRDGITERRADHRIGNSSIAASRIDDGLSGAQSTAGEPCLNHAEPRTVFHRSTWVEPFRFYAEFDIRKLPADALEPKQRRVPDAIEYRA